MSDDTTKRCRKCDEVKPLDAFAPLRNACKDCERARHMAYYYANRDRAQTATRAWQTNNRERHLEQKREYRTKNHDKVAAYRKAYGSAQRANNPEKKRERDRKWSAANRDRENARLRAYYAAHPERRRASICASKARHPEVRAAEKERRTARIAANGGDYTPAQWRALCVYFGHQCLCCGIAAPLTVDHVVPLIEGGRNDIANIQPLCLSCNVRKATTTVDYREPERLEAFLLLWS